MPAKGPELIGRLADMAAVDGVLTAARKGQGGAAFIFGDSGVGKTQLITDAVSGATAHGMITMRGRARTTVPGAPYRPIAEALLSLLRSGVTVPPEALGAYRAILGQLVPEWSAADGPLPAASPLLVAEGLLRLGSYLGSAPGAGFLFAIDDLELADLDSLAAVEYFADNLSGLPVALLVTVRDPSSESGLVLRGSARRTSATVIRLRGLDRAGVHELVRNALADVAAGNAEIPDELSDYLAAITGGNPLMVDELVQDLLDSGRLTQADGSWRVAGPLAEAVAPTLVRAVAERIARLDERGRAVLSAAALLGARFPLSVVQRMVGLDDRPLLGYLHRVDRLVGPDDADPDWYCFRHPLFADCVLRSLTAATQRDLAAQAAAIIEELHPSLPGDWCQLAAEVHRRAGHAQRAATHLAEAGRRALAIGASASAIALLEQAQALLGAAGDVQLQAPVVETLLLALAESGEVERAFAFSELLDQVGAELSVPRRVAIHVRLAWAAHVAGRWQAGLDQVERARHTLGADPPEEQLARVDAVAAHLYFDTPEEGRARRAEELARSVAEVSERHNLGELACQAWFLLGQLARERDLDESDDCFERVGALADRGGLATWRIYGVNGLAGNAWLRDADTAPMEAARESAHRLGAVALVHAADAILALDAALRGQMADARSRIEAVATQVTALRLSAIARYALMVQAVIAGQQGQRAQMDAALVELVRWDGANSPELALGCGLGRVPCALLEENRNTAVAEFTQIARLQARAPSRFFLSGQLGLAILLRAVDEPTPGLAGSLDSALASSSGQMIWNRMFLLFARAVLAGRDGEAAAADESAGHAMTLAAGFPVARHLAARLVAEHAHADGWGEPAGWLRDAERFFQDRGDIAPASACRAMLRGFGERMRQRRVGIDRVPELLRTRGVTVREFEVLQLLGHRLSNKAIAATLSISPRTVEKHVASLMLKNDLPDRSALAAAASRLDPN